MRTIAITNQKGGSGKTTTAVNIAACLAEQGQRVLLVDLDPQASASSWLNVTSTGRGLTDIFTEDGVSLDGLVMVSSITGLEIIPASPFPARRRAVGCRGTRRGNHSPASRRTTPESVRLADRRLSPKSRVAHTLRVCGR